MPTVSAADALFPSALAVMVAVPTAVAVTNPSASTVATLSSSLAQLTGRPLSSFPAESSTVAVNCAVWPIDT